jgi:hypothetical protein
METKNDNLGCSLILGVALLVLFLGFLLTGCTTQRKAVKYFDNHGFAAAQYCAGAYPVKDSTVYLHGQTTVVHHTDTIPGDSIPCPVEKGTLNQGTPVYVHCPPSTHTIDTITRTDTTVLYRENTARVAALTGQLAVNTDRAEKAENGRGKWRLRALITWGILALGGGAFVAAKFKII